ncbi:hypothetical protein BDA99DRAFT_474355 [Phascolomyces articulosus]|uniref:Homeobox domain-containing protein n=1 Tax=Phascolomyces articulosus TaxID=60185 RepID=A0AAD5PLE8_9FUNG|nr:hypothetical protein BDA99DRAFT_474355 [Phascolomyces articulosus]
MMNKYRHRSNTNPIMAPPSCPTMSYPTHHHHHHPHHPTTTNMGPPSAPTRKRTHLKPSQVAVLQESFVTNPLPDASIRCRLARELGVTERTIQIWFQNRRAKARKLEATCPNGMGPNGKIPSLMPNVRTGWIEPPPRHHHPNGSQSSPQRYQATFRTMMTPERFEEMQQQQQQEQQQQEIDVASQVAWQQPMLTFPVAALRVGSWARFAGLNDQQWDLVCYAHQRQLIWQIQDDGHQFRIQIDFSAIQQLVLTSEIQEDMTMADQIQVHLHHPGDLTFSMWRAGIDQDWIRCGDFSENKQATYQAIHVLQGNQEMLRQALFDLFNQAPDMISKCAMMESNSHQAPPALELCRDFTLSPSATPEPAMTTAAMAYSHHVATTHNATSGGPWMMPSETSSYLPTTTNSKTTGLEESAWLQQHQQPWDNSWQVLPPSSSFTTPSTTMDVNFL